MDHSAVPPPLALPHDLAAHLNATTYRLLTSIREFDERGGWHGTISTTCYAN